MTPELETMLEQLEAIKTDGQAVTAGLDDARSNWRPGPERWSIAECLQHLNVAVTRTLPAFDRAIAEGRSKQRTAPGPFRYGWFSRWMVRSMEPPPKRRMGTFPIFALPAGATYAAAQVLAEVLAVRDRLVDPVRPAGGTEPGRIKVVFSVNHHLPLPTGVLFH